MLVGYITIVLLFIFVSSCFSFDAECDYVCDADGCELSTRSTSLIKSCTIKDIPSDIDFLVIEHKNNSELPACYAVQLQTSKDIEYVHTMKHNKYFRTNYKRTEIIKPSFDCHYDLVDNGNNEKKVKIWTNFTVPIVKAVTIVFKKMDHDACYIQITQFDGITAPHKTFYLLDDYIRDIHNFTAPMHRSYSDLLSLETEIPLGMNYCTTISLADARCKESTLWKPPVEYCFWYIRCFDKTDNRIESYNSNNNNIYVYQNIVIVTLSVLLTLVGVMFFICIIYIYVHHNVQGNKKKAKCEDTGIRNTDIVLLYPKGSESFMELMTEFREILSQVCQCVVHDWYSGTEWNYVAKIGASDWFAEMLHKECRVVWIDTPAMRSLILQKFHKASEHSDSVEIGDFRDVVLPEIFNLCKRKVKQSTLQEPKHFIIRLKGFENFENTTDPFVHLSAEMRYSIPRDLKLLYSHL
ncbi:uncharacterized protein LOC143423537 isoform X2 [Xylocopa sonorina]|uniref:uncharacterized protein LOC143423537 isoform X2 n=1 Tax=Xylocopa sonorina TaxID=1818115 RepID=UPI00403A9442